MPRRSRAHEQNAIANIFHLPPGPVPFLNIHGVLVDFFNNEFGVHFRDIQDCPFGSAYVQFHHVSDRDRLIAASPIPFQDVHVSFVKHNEGDNWRRTQFNNECWVMLVGPPLDHWHTEDLNAIFADIGKVLLWERDPDQKGRIIAKIRVTDLVDIPKSVRFTIGDLVEIESWTFSVEVLQSHLLGGGPPEEDPLPDDNVDPHPVPEQGPVFGPQVPPPPSPSCSWG